MTCEVWISFLMWSFNVDYRELVRWEIIYPLSTIGVETWSSCFFLHLMKLTAKAKAIVRACWELRACKPHGLRNNFFSLIEGRVAFIPWTLRHISILVRYWSLHRYSKRIFRSFLHDFHMVCRFTGWLVPWQSAAECVFSGENLHQCGSGWGGLQTFGIVDFTGCWNGCWVHQTIDHWLLQNYCTQGCFVY